MTGHPGRKMRFGSALLGAILTVLAGGQEGASGESAPAVVEQTLPPDTTGRPANVLLIYAEARLLPGIVALDRAVRASFESLQPRPFFYTEYLDTSFFAGEAPHAELRELLRRKYADRQLDLVIAGGTSALDIALDNQADVFSGIPIVFIAERPPAVALERYTDVTGVWTEVSWAGTLDTALRLHPDTQRVAVVAGVSRLDQAFLAVAKTQLAAYKDRVEITYLTNLAFEEARQRVAALPPRTILLVGSFLRDAAGQDFIGADAASRLAAASRVPVYGPSETFVGGGIIGGHVMSFEALGRRGGELAVRVLGGERSPPIESRTNRYIFDGRQLQRWGIDEAGLPPGSEVRFRPPSAWEQYRWYAVGGAGVLVIQSSLIAGLLLQRARGRRAQLRLDERLRFEALLAELSATFVALPPAEVDHQIEQALRRILEALDLDRCTLAETRGPAAPLWIRHGATRPGIEPVRGAVQLDAFPWMRERLVAGHDVRFSRLDELPLEATTDRRSLLALGARSVLAVPLKVGGAVVGALSFATVRAHRDWPEELVQRLHLVAEIFANALGRQRADHAIRESEGQFRLAREELAHALRVATLGELVSGLAHEVNQPLAAVLTNAQAARRLLEAGSANRGDVLGALVDIADDARRAAQIIQDLRAMLRKERAGRTRVDINEMLTNVVRLLADELERKRIVIWLSLGEAVPPVHGDAVQLKQVTLNVIVNACEALAAVEGYTREILIETARRGPGLLGISVRDTGIGIKEAELERMFERFVTTKPDGLGMGLAISRSIVEAHGGRIWASANADRGVTVSIELPCEKGALEA